MFEFAILVDASNNYKSKVQSSGSKVPTKNGKLMQIVTNVSTNCCLKD